MSNTHYEIHKGVVFTVMGILLSVIISLLCYGTKTYISYNKEVNDKQDDAIIISQRNIEAGTQQIMALDKAVGIIDNDAKNHKENPAAHHFPGN